ncbi:hypothetical protein CH063_04700, partial [Colletotrichum higginsianum]
KNLSHQTCHRISPAIIPPTPTSRLEQLHYPFLLIDPLQAALMNGRPSVFTSQDYLSDHLWKAASP